MNIKKNLLYNLFYQILIIILPLITTPYIARVIGPEGVGTYSYTHSIANYFVLVAMLGLNNYGNRSIAEVRDSKDTLSETFWSIYTFQFITSLCVSIVYIIYIIIFVPNNRSMYLIQLLYVGSAFVDINWLFFGLEQFKITILRNTVIKLVTVLCIFIFVKDTNDLDLYTFIMSLGVFISQTFLWFFTPKFIYRYKPTFSDIIKHIRPNLVLFIPVISISIYKIMDKIMLGAMSSVIEVGYFENAEKIVNIPITLISALGVVMLPRMTKLISSGSEQVAYRYIEKSLKFIMFISFGACFGLISIAPQFIPLFLGDKFTKCIPIVSLLAFTILFISWANVIRTQYLIPKKKDKIYIYSTLLGACVNIIMNILLIPFYGAIGAAIGTIFAEGTVAIYQTIKIRRELKVYCYVKSSLYSLFPAFFMYYVLSNLNIFNYQGIYSIVIKMIIGGGIYVLTCFVFNYLFDLNFRYIFRKKSSTLIKNIVLKWYIKI